MLNSGTTHRSSGLYTRNLDMATEMRRFPGEAEQDAGDVMPFQKTVVNDLQARTGRILTEFHFFQTLLRSALKTEKIAQLQSVRGIVCDLRGKCLPIEEA